MNELAIDDLAFIRLSTTGSLEELPEKHAKASYYEAAG